jgi:hypothetical protein
MYLTCRVAGYLEASSGQYYYCDAISFCYDIASVDDNKTLAVTCYEKCLGRC